MVTTMGIDPSTDLDAVVLLCRRGALGAPSVHVPGLGGGKFIFVESGGGVPLAIAREFGRVCGLGYAYGATQWEQMLEGRLSAAAEDLNGANVHAFGLKDYVFATPTTIADLARARGLFWTGLRWEGVNWQFFSGRQPYFLYELDASVGDHFGEYVGPHAWDPWSAQPRATSPTGHPRGPLTNGGAGYMTPSHSRVGIMGTHREGDHDHWAAPSEYAALYESPVLRPDGGGAEPPPNHFFRSV